MVVETKTSHALFASASMGEGLRAVIRFQTVPRATIGSPLTKPRLSATPALGATSVPSCPRINLIHFAAGVDASDGPLASPTQGDPRRGPGQCPTLLHPAAPSSRIDHRPHQAGSRAWTALFTLAGLGAAFVYKPEFRTAPARSTNSAISANSARSTVLMFRFVGFAGN